MAKSEGHYPQPGSRGRFCLCIGSLSPRTGARSPLSLSHHTPRLPCKTRQRVCHRLPGAQHLPRSGPQGLAAGPCGHSHRLEGQTGALSASQTRGSEDGGPFTPPPRAHPQPWVHPAPPSLRMAPRSWCFIHSALLTPAQLTVTSLLRALPGTSGQGSVRFPGPVAPFSFWDFLVSPEDLGCSPAARPPRALLPAHGARGPAQGARRTRLSPPVLGLVHETSLSVLLPRECLSGRDRPRVVCGHVLPPALHLLAPRAPHSGRPPLQPEKSMSSWPLLSRRPRPPTLRRGVGTPCLWDGRERGAHHPSVSLTSLWCLRGEQVSGLVLQTEPPPPAFHLSHPTSPSLEHTPAPCHALKSPSFKSSLSFPPVKGCGPRPLTR